MVMHPHRAGARTPTEPSQEKRTKDKGGKRSTKQEPEKQPATPGLLTPGPVVPGLLTPGCTSVSAGSTSVSSEALMETSRIGSKASVGREQKQEVTPTTAAAPTLSLDSLVISNAKSVAGPAELPGLAAYTLGAQSAKAASMSLGTPPKYFGTPPKLPDPSVSPGTSVPNSILSDSDDRSDEDEMKLAQRLLSLLDENDILYLACELQSQGYLQEFELDMPQPRIQQLPSMMPHPIPSVTQQTFAQNPLPQSPQPCLEKQVVELQQMLSGSGSSREDQQEMLQQHAQPMYPQSQPPQFPQPESVKKVFPAKLGSAVGHKLTSLGLQSPQPRLESVLEELEEPTPAFTSPSVLEELEEPTPVFTSPSVLEEPTPHFTSPSELTPPSTSPNPRPDEQAECTQEALTPETSQPEEAAPARKLDLENARVSTLLIENLPPSFSQQATRDWVDCHGYRDLYDMLMWFPAKQSAKSSASRAFINFRSPDQAKRFRKKIYDFTMSTEQAATKLRVCTAKEQGFTANFIRFWHLSQIQDPACGICPFFARDMVAMVSPEDKELAEANLRAPHEAKPVARKENPNWTATTLVIRNLPRDVDTQALAIKWLLRAGHKNFNFLLFMPRKQNYKPRSTTSTLPGGLAYLFVNFSTAREAHMCSQALHRTHVAEGAPPLSVVAAAKVQGYQACRDYFEELEKSGRLVPWFEPDENSKVCQKPDEEKPEGNKTPSSDGENGRHPGSWQLHQ